MTECIAAMCIHICCTIVVSEVSVDGYKVPNLGRQLLYKYIKCKHQHSGRGILLTISTSVGKYLYVGELTEKTHFMSRETHSIDQGKRRNQLERVV